MTELFLTPVHDAQLVWRYSPILRGAIRTLNYLVENGPIGLTPTKALKRYFVEWAAEVFEWPGFEPADLYAVNKVLNEQDFPPLVMLHDLLLNTRLARHHKGHLTVTRLGRALLREPTRLWSLLLNELLFHTDHGRYMREPYRFDGDWEMILDIINLEAHLGASEDQICAALININEEEIRRDYVLSSIIYMYVLRPLTWSGLLSEVASGSGLAREYIYLKTPLWAAALDLPSDALLPAQALH